MPLRCCSRELDVLRDEQRLALAATYFGSASPHHCAEKQPGRLGIYFASARALLMLNQMPVETCFFVVWDSVFLLRSRRIE